MSYVALDGEENLSQPIHETNAPFECEFEGIEQKKTRNHPGLFSNRIELEPYADRFHRRA